MLKIDKIYQRYYGDRKLYDKKQFSIKEGITVLCGCNGSGKTTLLKQFKDYIESNYSDQISNKEVKLITFDENGLEGRFHADKLFLKEEFSEMATDLFSSEGERRFDRFGYVIKQIGQAVKEKYKTIVCLIDGLDSGVSIDLLRYYSEGLQFVEKEVKKEGIELCILLTTNQYELTKGFKCLDITSLTDLVFNDYQHYCNYIMHNKEVKDKRIIEAQERAERKEQRNG